MTPAFGRGILTARLNSSVKCGYAGLVLHSQNDIMKYLLLLAAYFCVGFR